MTATSDLLNRAVEVLRNHAKAATPGPWEPRDSYPHLVMQGGDSMASTTLTDNPAADSRYIALMHPPVAMAVAGWLFSVAVDEAWEPETAPRIRERTAALMVAREVLREPEVKA